MEIKIIDKKLSVCKVKNYSKVNYEDEYFFLAKTDEENSLVCSTKHVPDNATHRDDGWKAFRIEGILDFSLIGVISNISALLAENGIGIFVISSYNTDYILVKEDNFERALHILADDDYKII